MSEKKTIQVNPNFLLGKKSNKTEKRKRATGSTRVRRGDGRRWRK